MDAILTFAVCFGLILLVWDCIEVGRNDAANLVNAVFGARVMKRRNAVWLAGLAVVLGAVFSSEVMETARQGVFSPAMLDELGPEKSRWAAVAIYISVYLVDTVLLYTYSAFGMPVSTTATLVFSLVGASIGVSYSLDIVSWGTVGEILVAIVVSIVLSGIAGFLAQRAFRGAIRDQAQDHRTVLLHGPWIAGIILTWLAWFMVMKGLKAVPIVERIRELTFDVYSAHWVLLVLWGILTGLISLVLMILRERATSRLFHATAIIGMLCMAFAFGQNDLANCASPGLSALYIYQHPEESVGGATKIEIHHIWLFACGCLMVAGMTTKNAQRVTRAEVNTGSQFDQVALWAPEWCRSLARLAVRSQPEGLSLAPDPSTTETGKRIHYDTLRASVIMAVSASVIAFASSRGYPISTTYVAFAAVIATGWGDRVFDRGDADLKLGRAIWVVTSWFLAGFIAMGAAGVVAWVLYKWTWFGFALALATNLSLRYYFRKRADRHEAVYHPKRPKPAPGTEASGSGQDDHDDD